MEAGTLKRVGRKSTEKCKIFNCDKRRGSYCCFYCERNL